MNIPAVPVELSVDRAVAAAAEPSLDDVNEQGLRIQELVEQIDALPDPATRNLAQECIQSVLAFYGHGLARILQLVEHAGGNDRKVFNTLASDKLVRGLLLIHGLHPVALATRVREALDKVRPYMESHGGNVELISLENGRAKLRLQGACKTCASSAVTLELAVRHALEEACPDLAGLEVEGAIAASSANPAMPSSQRAVPDEVVIEAALLLRNGAFLSVPTAGVSLIICKVSDQLFAYRDHCSACNSPLHLGVLADGVLTCHLGHAYDVQRAGRSLKNPEAHLDPFPLLVENGVVKVSVR